MKVIYSKYLIFGLITYLLTSLSEIKEDLQGKWQIETVIFEGDTLFNNETIFHTAKFYNSRNKDLENSEKDIEYIDRCIKSTFFNLKKIVLLFEKGHYSQTKIKPCWDHINFEKIENGKYSLKNDSITLYKYSGETLMSILFEQKRGNLSFTSKKFDYRIVYKKFKEE